MKQNKFSETNCIVDYNFLMVCNNYIVSILELADKNKWSSEKIDFKDKDKAKVASSKYDLFYFREHGYAKVINKSLYKHIIFSLVADYNIYVSDAIECASKGHFGTAFSLLRKPFKDDLLFIEMFYTKGYNFVAKFLKQPIGNFATDKITKDNKMKIMRKCCKKINFFTAKRLYSLRYSKTSKESLEKIWNKTSHIITSAKSYATEDGNLNIIFATQDVVEDNLVYFYKVACSVQLYFVTLLLNILKDECLISELDFIANMKQLYFAFSCTLEGDVPEIILDELDMLCPNCGSIINITDDILKKNYNSCTFIYKCDKCNKEHEVDRFICY